MQTTSNINFTFTKGNGPNASPERFKTLQAANALNTINSDQAPSQTSNMRNSEKRKVKRSFRPKASAILGLDAEDPISMNNTMTTHGKQPAEFPFNRNDAGMVYSSVENSSVDQNPKLEAKLALHHVHKGTADGSPE